MKIKKLTDKAVVKLLKGFTVIKEDDLFISTSRYKNGSISYSCDEDQENWDWGMMYFKEKGEVVSMEFSNEQLELLKEDMASMIEEILNEKEGEYVPYSRGEDEYQRWMLNN